MTSCAHCQHPGHEPHGCANNTGPMIHRTCTCNCGREGTDPAPYWTQQQEQNRAADFGGEQ